MPSRFDTEVDRAEHAIRCVDLSIARAGRSAPSTRVVDGVSFDLGRGAIMAVMGPTGAGKSSLAAVLSGRFEHGLAIVGGSAEVEGMAVRPRGRAHRRLTYVTGLLAQSAGKRLPARMTVADVIGEPITSRDRRVNSRALAVRVAGLLDELMLPLGSAAKYPYELSAGMRQRVALARALVLEPRVLITDDPFANLDIDARRAARAAITRRRDQRGMSALVVTNDRDAVADLSADVIVMRAGHVVGFGHGPDDVLWTPGEQPDSARRVAS